MDTQPCAAHGNVPPGEGGGPPNEAPQDVQAQITAEFVNRPAPIRATTYLQSWATNSRPVNLLCEGGGKYVVKALQQNRPDMARVLVNEQTVARIGELIHAAVPRVALIDVPQELIANQPQMSHMTPGLAHGSQFVENVTERMAYEHSAVAENRPRFTLLAVLFGWIGAQDHQFVYEKTAPHLVYSVDHGFFFPGQAAWTPASLTAAGAAQPDTQLIIACNATEEDIHCAIHELSAVDDASLTRLVAVPPNEWGLTMEDRIALLEFLIRRRDNLLAVLPAGN